MNVAICDDLKFDRQILIDMIEKYCNDYYLEVKISTYENGTKFLSAFSPKKYDLIFLDIYMNDNDHITGIEIAKQIRAYDKECTIVFISGSKAHALDAFEVDAMQYLVKPVNYDKIKNIFDKCQKLFSDSMRYIEVHSCGLSVKILIKNIIYIEVYNKTSLIHTKDKIIKTFTPLNKLWDNLSCLSFLRCHRSYIVNMYYIDSIFENDFLLKNNDKIPIRKDKISAIKQIYSDYLFKNMM